jgi:hypothetical protein
VAATGFLPGVLSFLRALSHLERIAHRPTTCSTNLNHLSHLERALYHWPTRPHAVQHCVVTTTHGEHRHSFPTGSTMAGHFLFPNPSTQDRLMLWLSEMRDKQSAQGSTQVRTVQTRDVPAISEINTGIFGFQGCTRVFLQRSDRSCSDGQVEWRSESLHGLPRLFYLHALGWTLVTLETACVPWHALPFSWLGT